MPTRGRKPRPGLKVVRRPGRATLYLRGTVRGISVFESTGTDDAALAEEARAIREVELFRGAVHGFSTKVTFAAAAVSYMQVEQRGPATLINVGKLVRHFGPSVTCDSIRQPQIDAAAKAICRSTSSPATIRRQVLTPTCAVLNHAARRGWCEVPRFERAKPAGRRTDWFTPAEAEALIAAAAAHLRPLLTFLFCTGARLGEALALAWAEVDLDHGRAVLRATKNGDDRILDLPPRAVAALAAIAVPGAGSRVGAVFRHQPGIVKHGGKRPPRAYRATATAAKAAYGGQIKRGWARALRQAGIARALTPHHTRHSWASWHYAAFHDVMRLRDDGGWRSVAMVERYTKLAAAAIGAEAQAFWNYRAQSVPDGATEREIA